MKPKREALEKAAEHLKHAKRAKNSQSAAISQARVEALNWAYGFDKDELHKKERELR